MESIAQELGLKRLPGWILIFLGIVDIFEKVIFVAEHLPWFATPWGRLTFVFLGLGYLLLLHYLDRKKSKTIQASHVFIAPQGIPLVLSGSRLELKMSIFSCSRLRLTAVNVEIRANSLRPIPMSSPESAIIEPFRPTAISVVDKNLNAEDLNVLNGWPQLTISGKASFAEGLEREIAFVVDKPHF